MSDYFSNWLENNKGAQALIDKSYKKYCEKNKKPVPKVNTELATLGDAVLKLVLCKILYEIEVKKLTEEKKRYESDEVLVKFIASHYNLLYYIKRDQKDEENYAYTGNPHKYIATAVEACLGQIFIDEKYCLNEIIKIVSEWMRIIDKELKNETE